MKAIAVWLFTFAVIGVWSASAQSSPPASPTPVRDQQALAILSASLRAAGGEAAVAKVSDFKASGEITYHLGGRDVKGQATLQGRGTTQFRFESTTAEETRSFVIGGAKNQNGTANGRSLPLPYHNAVNLGAMNFPFAAIREALDDASASIRFLGTVAIAGHQAIEISVQRPPVAIVRAGEVPSPSSSRDYYFDSQTFLPVAVQWMSHPLNNERQDFVERLIFGDFRPVDSVLVPFSISENLRGQQMWSFQAVSFVLNSGIPVSVFER
jgi:hypothetical protein